MRKFGPKLHDEDDRRCAACDWPFQKGDFTTLVSVGPGDDPRERARRDAGRPYNSVAVEVHWECSPYTEGSEQ